MAKYRTGLDFGLSTGHTRCLVGNDRTWCQFRNVFDYRGIKRRGNSSDSHLGTSVLVEGLRYSEDGQFGNISYDLWCIGNQGCGERPVNLDERWSEGIRKGTSDGFAERHVIGCKSSVLQNDILGR